MSVNPEEGWRPAVTGAIAALKRPPFRSCRIASVRGSGAVLVPFTADCPDDGDLIALLTRWRHENIRGFARIFRPTEAGTRSWARSQLVERPDRILFLVLEADGRPVAHVGLSSFDFAARTCEIDNIVRGEADAPPGRMADAIETMLDLAYRGFGPVEIRLRTFNDNARALALYHRLGFVPIALQPLKKIVDGEVIEWTDAAPSDPVDRFYLLMSHQRRDLP